MGQLFGQSGMSLFDLYHLHSPLILHIGTWLHRDFVQGSESNPKLAQRLCSVNLEIYSGGSYQDDAFGKSRPHIFPCRDERYSEATMGSRQESRQGTNDYGGLDHSSWLADRSTVSKGWKEAGEFWKYWYI